MNKHSNVYWKNKRSLDATNIKKTFIGKTDTYRKKDRQKERKREREKCNKNENILFFLCGPTLAYSTYFPQWTNNLKRLIFCYFFLSFLKSLLSFFASLPEKALFRKYPTYNMLSFLVSFVCPWFVYLSICLSVYLSIISVLPNLYQSEETCQLKNLYWTLFYPYSTILHSFNLLCHSVSSHYSDG